MKINLNQKIGQVKLNLNFYCGKDLYSDGDIEDELLEICKSGQISEALKNSNKWPILYHLSEKRENLLEWYDFDKNCDILEVGAGCGALTGLLCQKAKSVTCIELSKKRSSINAYKNINCDNLEIIVGNFEEIEFEKKYDYVTLIGVLEYAPAYINSQTPFEDFLKKIISLLKPNGKIIIGIENKFGLKYWAGAYEDHTGTIFSGIENYKDFDHVKTFTKNEFSNLLDSVGLSKQNFYYPLPDYKLPDLVISDAHSLKIGDIRNVSKLYDNNCFQFFSEDILYDNLCSDNMVSTFFNSFLVFCEPNKENF